MGTLLIMASVALFSRVGLAALPYLIALTVGTQVLSQTSDEGERIYHFTLPTQPKHKTVPLAFGTRSRGAVVVLCEAHA